MSRWEVLIFVDLPAVCGATLPGVPFYATMDQGRRMVRNTGIVFLLLAICLLGIPQRAQAAFPPPEDCGEYFVARWGDSLGTVSRLCGVTVAGLLMHNPQISRGNPLYPGQRLILKEPAAPLPDVTISPLAAIPGSRLQVSLTHFPASTTVELSLIRPDGERMPFSVLKTSLAGELSVEVMIVGNPGESWYVTASLPEKPSLPVSSRPFLVLETLPDDQEAVYIVQPGDTLRRISWRFNRSLALLLSSNPEITDPNRIFLGQAVKIPAKTQPEQPAGVLQAMAAGERWVKVDTANQMVYAYEGAEQVRAFLVSTGKEWTPTIPGEFRIWVKLRYDDMRGPGYFLPDVPYVMYFYKGYGLHGTYWHNNFGTPMSYGCVNLSIEDARWLYNFVAVGTLVSVQ